MKQRIKEGIEFLKEPAKGFSILKKKSLEEAVGNYLKMLLLLCLAAASATLIMILGKAFFYSITRSLEVDYPTLINYGLTQSMAIVWEYLLGGTIIIFVISLIVRAWFRRVKYTEILKVVLVALYPELIFGWLPMIMPALSIWSLFLLFVGIKSAKQEKIVSGSIMERD